MAGRPQLKAAPGWKLRVIVCDQDGHYEYDDIDDPDMVMEMAYRQLWKLQRKKVGRRKKS